MRKAKDIRSFGDIMTDPQQQQQSIPGPVTDGPVCYRVSNVDPRATAADLEEHFNVFGQLRYVKVQHAVATQTTPGPSDRSLGEAFICFGKLHGIFYLSTAQLMMNACI